MRPEIKKLKVEIELEVRQVKSSQDHKTSAEKGVEERSANLSLAIAMRRTEIY